MEDVMYAPDPAQLLAFINSQSSTINLEFFLSPTASDEVIRPHTDLVMRGWMGICSLVGEGIDLSEETKSKQLYDIDIRWATSEIIFNQELFDFGWTAEQLLANSTTERHKLIIYLCDPAMTMLYQGSRQVSKDFLLGRAWSSITHIYTQEPHPFLLPDQQKLFTEYGTTAKLIQQAPTIQREFPNMLMLLGVRQGGLRTKGLFKHVDSTQPLLSIVTVVYNGEKYLEQTIQSVINQSYENLEYIIIDGGSTDHTLEIIAKYNDYINYWVSESDTGIYSAMNKGTKLATGSHVLHLNADDLLFTPNCLEFLSFADFEDNHMRSILKVDLATGQMVKDPISLVGNSLAENVTYQNRFLQVSRTAMAHPGFVSKINGSSIFNEDYRISSDTAMLINKFQTESVRLSAVPLSIFRSGGASSNNKIILAEMWQEVLQQPRLWPKIARWLQLQGIFASWK
jgi:Glycosyl transferase family 2